MLDQARNLLFGMDMDLSGDVERASREEVLFVLGALWAELASIQGDEANNKVREALKVAKKGVGRVPGQAPDQLQQTAQASMDRPRVIKAGTPEADLVKPWIPPILQS